MVSDVIIQKLENHFYVFTSCLNRIAYHKTDKYFDVNFGTNVSENKNKRIPNNFKIKFPDTFCL